MKKKLLGILLTAVLAVCAFTVCVSAATTISTADELIAIMNTADPATDWAKDYVLGGNIDLAQAAEGSVQKPIGTAATKFTGDFNGNGYKISGLELSGTSYIGLFGVAEGASILNLTVEGSVTVTSKYGGGIMGFGRNVNIINCVSKVNLSGPYVGGIVGILNQTTATKSLIFKCVNEGAITGASFSGGIVGQVNQTKASTVVVEACTNNGTVNGSQRLGGIVGYHTPAVANAVLTIEDCVNEKAVTGTGNIIGGILGYIEDKGEYTVYLTIHNCINNGDISAARYAGGIMGCHGTVSIKNRDVKTTLTNLYNKGTIKSTTVSNDGAIIGIYRAPLVTDGAYNVVWSDWHNEGTSARGMVAEVALLAAPFSAENIYNQTATQMFSTDTSTASYTISSNTITLTNSYNSASADLSALAADENWVMSSDSTVGFLSMEKVADTSIDSAEELVALMNDTSAWGGSYTLTTDIDLTGYYQKPIGNIVVPFTGTFDGGENTISGIDISGGDNVGLFGVTRGATIKNITLQGTVTATGQQVAAVSALAFAPATFENITSEVTISNSKGKHAGAIAGMIYFDVLGADVTVKNCTNESAIHSGSYSGGIVGVAGSVFNSIPYLAEKDVGGNDLTITGCVNRGDITADAGNVVGGIMGYYMYRRGSAEVSDFKLLKSANYGAIDVTAGSYVGGIIGAVLEINHGAGNQAYVTVELAELLSAGTISASSTSYMGSIVALLRVPVITDGVAPTSVHDCWNTAIDSYGMIGVCGAVACSWNAYNLYNEVGAYLIGKQSVTSGEVTQNGNVITLTNGYNNASADADALAGLVTGEEGCAWVNRYDLPELKEFAQEEVQATLDSVIDSEKELILLMNSPDRWAESYTLGANLNLENLTISPIGTTDNPFTGTFDGNSYTISNMTMSGATGVGLFGYVKNATIKDLNIADATVTGNDSVAALVGAATGSITIENCNVNANVVVSGARAAILVGDISSVAANVASITGCTTSGSVEAGTGHAGAIAGRAYANTSLTIENCNNSATIEAKTVDAGGLIGRLPIVTQNATVSIKNCTNSGSVTNYDAGGGLVGEITSYCAFTVDISGNTNTGNVSVTNKQAGGIVGYLNNYYNSSIGYSAATVTVNNNTNRGDVTSKYEIGGLIGLSISNKIDIALTINGSKNYGTITGGDRSGGLIGFWQTLSANASLNISNCENHGTIKGAMIIGGFIGRMEFGGSKTGDGKALTAESLIENCANYGDVTVDKALKVATSTYNGKYAGGFAGLATTTGNMVAFNNVYNEGAVHSTDAYSGGFFGLMRSYGNAGTGTNTATAPIFTLTNAENRGVITSDGVHNGGLVGYIANTAPASITSSATKGDVTGTGTTHAVIGCFDETETVKHVLSNVFYVGSPEDANATECGASTDFSALDTELWMVPVASYYTPELKAHHTCANVWYQVSDGTYSFGCICGSNTLSTAAEKPFVYVSQANGADTNDGLTADTAVATLDEAITRMAKSGGDVIIADRYIVPRDIALPAWEKEITFTTGVDASTPVHTGFVFHNHGQVFNMNGPAKFESIIFNGANINAKNNSDSGYYNIPIFAANWNDLTMGSRIVCYGVIYIVAGSNGVSESVKDLGGKTVNITLNRTSAQSITTTDADKDGVDDTDENGNTITTTLTGARATYDRIYLGDRVLQTYNSPYTVKNVHINFTSNNATFNNVWLATTSNATSNAQMENYTVTANFNGGGDAYIGTLRTGDGNTSGNGTAALTKLELNLNGNAYVRSALALRNIKELVMSVSAGADRLEGSTYKYNKCAFTIGVSDAYTAPGTVDITYGTHNFAKGIEYPTYTENYTVKETVIDECTREDVTVEHTADVIGSVTSTCTVCERVTVTEFHVLDYSTTAWSYDETEAAYVVVCPVCGEALATSEEAPTVYVGDDGDDTAIGTTADTKVKTITEAVERIAAVGGTVMFNGYVTISENTTLDDWGENTITFTTDTINDGVADGGLYITTNNVQLVLGGKAVFDTFALKGTNSKIGNVIISALWNDVTFTRIRSVDYGCCYLVAGQWGATESDVTPVNQIINVEGHTTNTARVYLFGRIYMGSEIQANDIEISNKNITLNAQNGFATVDATERTESNQVYTLYTMSTTGNNSYCNSTTNGCVSVVNMYGDMSVNSLRTGDRNTSIAACTGKCDDLTLNFMGNSNVDGTAYIRNCYKTTINVSTEAQGRTTPMAHSFFFYGLGSFVDSNAKVYLNYGSHSFVSAISYPPVTLDADNDGDAYVLVTDGIKNECEYTSEITTPATDTAFGVKTFTCTTCGRSYTEKVCGTYAHEYVKQADGTYLCQLCGATSEELVMPDGSVLITADAGEIADGKVTVDILIDSTAVAGALFTVEAPEGFTLESVTDPEDSFYREASGSKIMLINLGGTDVAVDNAVVATLTYTVDEKIFNAEGEIVVTALEVINAEEKDLYTLTVNGAVSHKHVFDDGVLVADTADKAAHYVYTCTTCGYTYEEAAEAEEYSAAYSSTVVLESDLRLQIVAKVADKITDPSKIWLIVESTDKKGNVITEVVNPYHAYPADEAQTAFVYRFNATRVAAKEIGDEISVTFCVNKDGVKYTANTVKCNIISYYKAAKNAGASDVVMNALDAMMNYGAAAQEYFNYKTDALATTLAGVEKIDYATNTSVTVDAETTYGTEGITTYTYNTLYASLKDKVVMVIKFNGAAKEGLVFKGSYTDIKGKEKTFETAATVENGVVVVSIDAIAAKDLRQAFTGALYNGDTQVSEFITTSFEAYATQAISSLPADTKLHAVCRAALAYSDAAASYFLSK